MFLGAFYGGYYVKGLVINKDALLQEKIAKQIEERQDQAVNKVASQVLTGLSTWRQNTKDVVKEMHFETTNPVFVNVCASDNYVRLFNERQEQARQTLSGKLDAKVSD